MQALYEAVRSRDILSLIQIYAEGVDLMEIIPQPKEHVWLHWLLLSTVSLLRYTDCICAGHVLECLWAHELNFSLGLWFLRFYVFNESLLVSVRNLERRCSTWRSVWSTETPSTSSTSSPKTGNNVCLNCWWFYYKWIFSKERIRLWYEVSDSVLTCVCVRQR